MKDLENDFSIDNILKAAKGHLEEPEKQKSLPKISYEQKNSHALTADEVLHKSSKHMPNISLPNFDAISESQDFIVFENDIEPEAEELPIIKVADVKPSEVKPTEAKPTESKPVANIKPAAPVIEEKTAEASKKPSIAPLYERLKQAQLDKKNTRIKPIGESAVKAPAPIPEPELPKAVKTEPEKKQTENPDGIAEAAPIKETSAKPQIKLETFPSVSVSDKPETAAPLSTAAKPNVTRSNLSIDDVIRAAEKKAASNLKILYKTPVSQPKTAQVPAQNDDVRSTVIEKNNDGEVKNEGTIFKTPFTYPQSAAVKRSRVFTTPTDVGDTAPVTKVVAKEIEVNIDVIDSSITEPQEDDRLKEHTPYASQYSLADADLPNTTLFSQGKTDAIDELFDGENEIVSSAKDLPTGKTIQFEPIKSIDDFDVDNILPPAEKPAEVSSDTAAFKLTGNIEQENSPEEEPNKFEDEPFDELNDYEGVKDAKSVMSYLKSKHSSLRIRLIPTFIIAVILILLATPLADTLYTANSVLYYSLNIVLLALAAVINLPTLRGLISLFSLRPDTDSPAALSVVGSLIQVITLPLIGEGRMLFASIGALALTFNLLGKSAMLSYIKRNFALIANDTDKQSLFLIDDEERIASQLADGSVLGDALIVANRKTTNATGFLAHSFDNDPYEKHLSKIILITLIGAVAAFVGGMLSDGLSLAITLFAAVLCIGCPVTTLLLCNLPMKLANKRLNRLDSMITDFASADDIACANAITLNASDLFPAGTVNLFNMHILAPNPIDRSILEAAAIAKAAGSPLATIFNSIVGDDAELPEVDTVKYEDRMGISGWIDDKRIFIGNRALMTAHNVAPMPSLDIDKRILKSGYFPVYLATTDGPCALFIVGYEADEEISYQLRRLSAEGVTLLINSCDQNLSEEMICDYFELYSDSVKVMSPQMRRLYDNHTQPQSSMDSFAVSRSDAAGIAALFTASIRLSRIYRVSLVLHIIFLIAGVAMIAAGAFIGSADIISTLTLLLFQAVTGGIVTLIQLLYKP